MSILIEVLNQLPNNNAVAFDAMLQELGEDDVLFLEITLKRAQCYLAI